MPRRRSILIPAMIALIAAGGGAGAQDQMLAQQEERAQARAELRAVQAARLQSAPPRRVQAERGLAAIALQQPVTAQPLRTPTTPRSPTPAEPQLYPIDWQQVAVDVREQRAGAFSDNNFTTAFQTQAIQFPAPRNPDRAAAAVNTQLPVLLPTEAALDMGEDPVFFLFPAEYHYTASFTGPGFLVEVFGTRRAHAQSPTPLAGRRLRVRDGEGYQVTLTRYGAELTFNRYGAAYSITVECDDPRGDPHCYDEAYIRDLAASLRYAAGQEGEE